MKQTIHFRKFLRTIGRNLYMLRIAQSKDVEVVSEAMEIIPHVLEQIEYGEYNWEVEMIVRLCEYYGVSIKEIVEESVYQGDNHMN